MTGSLKTDTKTFQDKGEARISLRENILKI